jgi:hypothetical protein
MRTKQGKTPDVRYWLDRLCALAAAGQQARKAALYQTLPEREGSI